MSEPPSKPYRDIRAGSKWVHYAGPECTIIQAMSLIIVRMENGGKQATWIREHFLSEWTEVS